MLSFSPAAAYPAGTDPVAVVTADFNSDGQPDLATANYVDNTVGVLLGNAGGTFQPVRTAATGAAPRSVAVGDFNADGKLDLATANAADVSVLLGKGDGTFQAPTSLGVGSAPTSVAVGDFDGDGKLDLGVTANVYAISYYYGYPYGYYYGTANVLLGRGDGAFNAPVANFLYYGWHTSAAVADFNGDGKQDFAAADYDYSAVTVLLGDGAGNLTSDGNWIPTGGGPTSLAAGDLNGDLKPDLVTANSWANSVSVLLRNGAGGFGAAQNFATGADPVSVTLGDFNNDGLPDIATANFDAGGVSVLRNRGGGLFWNAESFAAGAGESSVVAGDFNGDGWLDAATANAIGNNASVLLNDHSWPTPPPPAVSVSDAAAVTEGNTGSVNATFTLTLSYASNEDVVVHYETAGVTATPGSDFAAASADVVVPAGQTSATFTVAVTGDRVAESTETFAVNLTSAANATVADGQGLGAITDDEPRVSVNNASAREGNGKATTSLTFTVRLSAAYDQAVTVNFATANGTATAGSDYQAKGGSVTFAPGETVKTVTILVLADKQKEGTETFFLDLVSAGSNSAINVGRGTGTILDDDNNGRSK